MSKKIKLIIAGKFIKNKKKYINLIDKLSLKNHVICSNGFIRKRDIKYYMGASEIIVQPYIAARYGSRRPNTYQGESADTPSQ